MAGVDDPTGQLERLRSIKGVKWQKHGPDVLPSWVADMDLEPAPAVKDAIAQMAAQGDFGYLALGLEDLTLAWQNWVERRHGWRPPTDEIHQFTGSLHGLEAVMALHTRPGDGVVIFSPIYYPFRMAIEESGRRVVDVPLEEGSWRLDPERLRDAIDSTTKLVLFCQPHNPVGRVFDRDEIAALADVAEQHDLLVISDEVWADLIHDPNEHLPLYLADERLRERLVTLHSASKAFNLAGLRCALAHVGVPHIRRQFASFSGHLLGAPSTLGAIGTIAAWDESEWWLDEARAAITSRRDRLAHRLATEAPQVCFPVPQATYLGWLDFRQTDLGDDPAQVLLDEAGVALDQGEKFGIAGRGWARLNFATYEPILDEIIDRIVERVNR